MDVLARQRALGSVIERFSLSIEETPQEEWTHGLAQVRQDLLTSYWRDFQANHLQLLVLEEPPEIVAYHQTNSYTSTERMFVTGQAALYNTRSRLDEALAAAAEPQANGARYSATSSSGTSGIRLPRITIPIFTGKRRDWESFRDLFLSLIHNDEALSDVERLYYLKSHVDGEAKIALSTLQVVGSNYATAWGILESRYQHHRLLVEDHLSAILKLKPLTREAAAGLQSLLDALEGHRDQLRALGRPVDKWDDWFVTIASACMDQATRRTWEDEMEKLGRSEDGRNEAMATFSCLADYLRKRCRALSSVEASQPSTATAAPSQSTNANRNQRSARCLATRATPTSCPQCDENHYLGYCRHFLDMSTSARRDAVTRARLCYNCLRAGHSARTCPSRSVCQVCQALHHSTLHEDGRKREGGRADDSSSLPKQRKEDPDSATPPPTAANGHGRTVLARALFDACSEVTLVGLALARNLNGVLTDTDLTINGVSGESIERVKKGVRLLLHVPGSSSPISVDAYCMRRFGLFTPATLASQEAATEWRDLELADPNFSIPAAVDLVIGSNVLPKLLRPGLVKRSDVVAQRTAVGWTLTGRTFGAEHQASTASCLASQDDSVPQWHDELVTLLQRFWEIEEVPRANRVSPLDEACERLFADRRRAPDGRYILRLPLKAGASQLLGRSLASARAALAAVHRRMERDPDFAQHYRRFMDEYISCGHMRAVTSDTSSEHPILTHYIPHHGIWQKGDQGRKLRVVFNASRPTSTGRSLNDVLHTGPKLQTDLWRVLVGWRRHRIAFCADIKMMFRQIAIDSRDVDYQRILWSPYEREPATHYQLLTVTYGEACAPYLSLRTLQQLCQDEGASRPLAAEAVLRDRYVDDILSGSGDLESARELRDQIIDLLQAGGFPLRKWVSNAPELLQDLPAETRLRPDWVRLAADGPVNELGIAWDVQDDEFRITPPILENAQRTKREILAATASLFDPCGWLAPVILNAKILLQDLWRGGMDWDDHLRSSMARRWEAFKEDLPLLADIRIPRWVQVDGGRRLQLHAFSDASRRAMAAAIYLRATDDSGDTSIFLIAAKTKLNSVKSLKPSDAVLPRMTMPRLELRATVMAARLLRSVAEVLRISSEMCHLWCDAQIVLHWVQSPEPVGHALIDNYISHVQELQPDVAWHYVPTDLNPADVATRGADVKTLATHRLWFGPAWLRDPSSSWPSTDRWPNPLGENVAATVTCTTERGTFDLFAPFSDLNLMLRLMVRLRRWVRSKLSRGPSPSVAAPITASEMNDCSKICVKLSQARHLAKEIKNVRAERPASTETRLRLLDLFVCPEGLLRVGGRLNHSTLPYDARHPPLLSGNCKLADLTISWAHRISLHGGFRATYAFAMRRAWIIGGRRRIRSELHHCLTCARARATPMKQKMAALPPERVIAAGRAFSRTGVDYAGPFQILSAKGRGVRTTKGYVALFVCLNTKALHLKLVGDLTTESFLGALTRFSGRRGKPAELWSDNATTFRRADADLTKAFEESSLQWGQVSETLAADGITWRYIPPGAPHFGGLWEAGVKLVKTHLKRVVGPRHLTYEEFSTLLVNIETVLNCRPLAPISGDPDDLDALTAGHFLIGGPLTVIPDIGVPSDELDHLAHWKLVRGLLDRFWAQWSHEYLHTLQQRQKWTRPRSNLEVGDFVVILDASLLRPRGQWPMGRVTAVTHGRDGLVRSATVRTSTGEYVRPVVKFSRIPVISTTEASPIRTREKDAQHSPPLAGGS